MAKVRIKKLPRGYKVNKGRLLKTMNSGGKTGDQNNYGLTTFPNNENISLDGNPFNDVNSTLGPVSRDEANLEAERGETALTDLNNDGAFELYNIAGNRHSSGGTPLNLPPQSFIYSDTASMKLTKDELLEMGIASKKKITPAKVSKKYDLNKYIGVLNDPNSDHIAVDTAEYMLDKNKKKLSQLAFIQEAKKGFEEGVPLAAYPYIQGKGMDPIQFSQQVQNISAQEAQAEAMMQLPIDMRQKVMQLQQLFKQIDLEKNPEKLDKHIAQKQEINPSQGQGMPNMQAPPPMQAPPAMAAYGREIPQAQMGYFKDKFNQAKNYASDKYNQATTAYKDSSFYKTGQKALDYTQDALSVAGAFPVLGAVPDLINTGISANRLTGSQALGDKKAVRKNAEDLAWNAAAIVPIAGQAATAGKFGKRVVKAVNKRNQATGTVNLAQDIKDEATGAQGSISNISSNAPTEAPAMEAPKANMAQNVGPGTEEEAANVARAGGDPFGNLKKFTDKLNRYQDGEEVVDTEDDISDQDQETQTEGTQVAPRKQGEFQYSEDSEAVRNIMQDQYNIYEMPDEGSIQGIDNQSRADGSLDYADEDATRNIISSPEGQQDHYDRNKNTFADIGITDFDMYKDQYVGRGDDSDVVQQFQTKHRENYLHAFDNDEELRNKLIEQFGDEDTARKAFMSSMSFTEDGKGNPFGIDNKHGVYTHGVSDFSKKPDEIVCMKCDEESGEPITQVFNKEEGCGEGWVPEGSALDCGKKDEEKEKVETVDQVPAEPEFWLQDQLGLMNAIDNKFNLKKYYPWAPRIEAKQIDAVFEDPTREIAAIGEQAAIAAQTATAFSGPQRAGAVQAKAQGVAAQQIADTMSRVQGSNTKTANMINSKNAELMQAADLDNKAQMKKLYDDTTMTEQNYDNALKEANAEVTKQMQNMYTNRAYTHNLNQLYPEFNVHPQTGGLAIFDPTAARDITDSGRVSTDGSDTNNVDDYLTKYNIKMEDLTAEERMKLYNSQGDVNTRGISSDPRQQYMQNTIYPGGQKQTQVRRGKEVRKKRILQKGAELRNWFSPLRAMSKR
tara:strand:- start:26502 stop:29702 length:3201 start_codon:yes stop_codon:yes gene_type:complete